MNILVLNCGSSSVKFQIIQTDLDLMKKDADRCLASGNLEKIGSEDALVTMRAEGRDPLKACQPLSDHRDAVDVILKWVVAPEAQIEGVHSLSDIDAVGHRIVHGGEHFVKSVLVDDSVIEGLEEVTDLAPLHNPAHLKGIRACRELMGLSVPQVVVFDTAFHMTMPPMNYIYGLPYSLYENYKIRRYGFHGTSHRYIANKYAQIMGLPIEKVNIISLHLGNGASVCAIKNGQSIDTSMGFTPLAGLLMGTRCGDLDVSIIPYLAYRDNQTIKGIDTLINKQSGLLGVSGISSDMRDLEAAYLEKHDRRAELALSIFCQRVKKYIGSYFAEMNGTDAIVFTGGVGQNSPFVRERVCTGMEKLGIVMDLEKNGKLPRSTGGIVSADNSAVRVLALPTNEELLIARDTVMCVTEK